MKTVEFVRNETPYREGEVVEMEDGQAEKVIRQGAAIPFDDGDDGWVDDLDDEDELDEDDDED